MKILKWLGLALAGLVGLIVVAVVVSNVLANSRVGKRYDVDADTIEIATDDASLERGEHLVTAVTACSGCHGADLGGKAFFDDPQLGLIYSANLTSGEGGRGDYTDADWVRALTHGIGPDGQPLIIMPSQNYRYLSDDDLSAIIAYVKSVPAVDRSSPEPDLTLIGQTLFGLGGLGRLPAEIIDHDSPRPEAPAPGVTAEYGGYLVNIGTCKDCHSQNLAGGQVAPGEPYAPNLTPGGELTGWAEDDFIRLIRSGQTPTGRQISEAMPWEEHYQYMTDEELQAIWTYLGNLEPLPTND